MPIYEYSCSKCGKTLEAIQMMSDKPLKTHAGCGGKLTRLISAAGFQFKGTGWYVTDYARKGKPADGESPADSSKDSKTETASTTECKGESTGATDKASTSPKAEKSPKPDNLSRACIAPSTEHRLPIPTKLPPDACTS